MIIKCSVVISKEPLDKSRVDQDKSVELTYKSVPVEYRHAYVAKLALM